MKKLIKNYSEQIILLAAILIGALLGAVFPVVGVLIKPLGAIWLNLLSTAVVPLVFFSISSAIAGMNDIKRLGKILFWMLIVFIGISTAAALMMLAGVHFFPITAPVHLTMVSQVALKPWSGANALTDAFTVSDFGKLLLRENMLALIVFSALMGFASSASQAHDKNFSKFLISGNEVMMNVIALLMRAAPVGLGAYFAAMVAELGPQIVGTYSNVALLYYPVALLYFFFFFSLYALWAGGKKWIKTFWQEIIPPALTALGTGSSVATIPSNLQAADRMGMPREVSEIVIPVGAVTHKSGSCLSAILKIALLHAVFDASFSGFQDYGVAIGVAVLSGVVMGGIPGGGFLGEMLIITLYGFPMEGLPIISMVGILVDPPATLVNAVGDNIAGALTARITYGKKWRVEPPNGN